ncbi:MAG: hypothetical protein AAGU14_07440 [Eubacteriaceae bacterium]
MNKLYLFIMLLCMITFMLAMLYLLLQGDDLVDMIKNKKNDKKKLTITQYDEDLLNRFLHNFSEQDLIRINNIMNVLNEKQMDM